MLKDGDGEECNETDALLAIRNVCLSCSQGRWTRTTLWLSQKFPAVGSGSRGVTPTMAPEIQNIHQNNAQNKRNYGYSGGSYKTQRIKTN